MRRAMWIVFVVGLMAGCQATSTGGSYHPANCAMVGSSCESPEPAGSFGNR
jgi:hypothetical protein